VTRTGTVDQMPEVDRLMTEELHIGMLQMMKNGVAHGA
jgi:hypothetical protein